MKVLFALAALAAALAIAPSAGAVNDVGNGGGCQTLWVKYTVNGVTYIKPVQWCH